MTATSPRILIIFSSLFGANAELARRAERTVEQAGAEVRTRGVPQLVLAQRQVPRAEEPYATANDLDWADGLIITSPSHTGLPSASIKAFIDEHHSEAIAGRYVDKTFTAMCTSNYAHAGQERVVSDLNAMAAVWGCVIIPPSTANARINELDGNPYGLSFVLAGGKLPETAAGAPLQAHLKRFVLITRALSVVQRGEHRVTGAELDVPPRNSATDVFG